MSVRDHGIEVLKKSGEEVVPGSPADYYIKVGGLPGSPINVPPIPVVISFTLENSLQAVYNEVSAVASSVSTLINSYTVPVDMVASLQRIEVSGTNIAEYSVKLNSFTIVKKRTYFPEFNAQFEFWSQTNAGLNLNAGDLIEIYVVHERPDVGDFNSTIEYAEI